MKTSALLLASLLPLASCGGDSGPVGTWQVDVEATLTTPMLVEKLDGLSQEDRAGAMSMHREQVERANPSIDIQSGNTFTMHYDTPAGHTHMTGTWKLEGDRITMVGREEDRNVEQTMVFEIDGDVMTLMNEGVDVHLVYRRVR